MEVKSFRCDCVCLRIVKTVLGHDEKAFEHDGLAVKLRTHTLVPDPEQVLGGDEERVDPRKDPEFHVPRVERHFVLQMGKKQRTYFSAHIETEI